MRPDIHEGAQFPNYALADQEGNARTIAELQGANPMVLHLSRAAATTPRSTATCATSWTPIRTSVWATPESS